MGQYRFTKVSLNPSADPECNNDCNSVIFSIVYEPDLLASYFAEIKYLIHFWSNKDFQGTVVNWKCHSWRESDLKIRQCSLYFYFVNLWFHCIISKTYILHKNKVGAHLDEEERVCVVWVRVSVLCVVCGSHLAIYYDNQICKPRLEVHISHPRRYSGSRRCQTCVSAYNTSS